MKCGLLQHKRTNKQTGQSFWHLAKQTGKQTKTQTWIVLVISSLESVPGRQSKACYLWIPVYGCLRSNLLSVDIFYGCLKAKLAVCGYLSMAAWRQNLLSVNTSLWLLEGKTYHLWIPIYGCLKAKLAVWEYVSCLRVKLAVWECVSCLKVNLATV